MQTFRTKLVKNLEAAGVLWIIYWHKSSKAINCTCNTCLWFWLGIH